MSSRPESLPPIPEPLPALSAALSAMMPASMPSPFAQGRASADAAGIGSSIAMVRMMFDESPLPTMVQGVALKIVAVNAAFCELTGYRPPQLIGMDPLMLYPDEDRAALVAQRLDDALRVGSAVTGELRRGEHLGQRLRNANGALLPHRLAYREMRGPDARVYLVSTIVDIRHDIATRRLVEARSRRVESFFDFSPQAMVMRDARLCITAVNPAFSRLTGLGPEDVVGRPAFFSDPDSRDSADLLRGRLESMVADRGAFDDTRLRLRCRSGRSIWIMHQTARIDDESREGFISVLREIETAPGNSDGLTFPFAGAAPAALTMPMRSTPAATMAPVTTEPDIVRQVPVGPTPAPLAQFAEATGDMQVVFERRASEAKPDEQVDSGIEPLARVVYCNQQVRAIMGVEREAVLASPDALLQHVSAADRQRFQTVLRRSQASSSNGRAETNRTEIEIGVLHPGSGLRVVRLRLMRSAESAHQSLLLGEDVTEARADEHLRLAAAHQQRDVLVREVHHRIKNNLQGVAGLLQQMADRRPELASSLDDIAGQVQAIAQVHGLHVQDKQPLVPARMVEAVFTNLARNFGVPIAFDSTGAGDNVDWVLPEQEAVPIALTINELGTNAIKHRKPGGRIGVRWDNTDSGVSIEISNEGELPGDFSFVRLSHGNSGLGLIKSMLPRRGAELRFETQGERVIARLRLKPPAVTRGDNSP